MKEKRKSIKNSVQTVLLFLLAITFISFHNNRFQLCCVPFKRTVCITLCLWLHNYFLSKFNVIIMFLSKLCSNQPSLLVRRWCHGTSYSLTQFWRSAVAVIKSAGALLFSKLTNNIWTGRDFVNVFSEISGLREGEYNWAFFYNFWLAKNAQ